LFSANNTQYDRNQNLDRALTLASEQIIDNAIQYLKDRNLPNNFDMLSDCLKNFIQLFMYLNGCGSNAEIFFQNNGTCEKS